MKSRVAIMQTADGLFRDADTGDEVPPPFAPTQVTVMRNPSAGWGKLSDLDMWTWMEGADAPERAWSTRSPTRGTVLPEPPDRRWFIVDLFWRLGGQGRENLHRFASQWYSGGESNDYTWWNVTDRKFWGELVDAVIERRVKLPYWASDEALAHEDSLRKGRAP
jgi:hypothetical protein